MPRNARYPKSYKQTALVNRQPHWPQIQKPEMSMKLVESNQNTYIFKFDHNDLYREKQRDFYRGVETLDAINIESIIHRNPYHVDALIQLSEYCKLNEDLQIAAELIERGIYFMEYVTHPLFSLTSANCRLPYKFQENRFRSNFHHTLISSLKLRVFAIILKTKYFRRTLIPQHTGCPRSCYPVDHDI